MKQPDIVSPIATASSRQCTITARWFVPDTLYPPGQATYKPLVNGEEAFTAVHHAIANAKSSVDIICWGFQPSMYFLRDGQAPCIGELLEQLSQQKQVKVRILGWEMPFNAAGLGGEANLPGKGVIRIKDRVGKPTSLERYRYDCQWFDKHAYKGNMLYTLAGNMGVASNMAQFAVSTIKAEHSSLLFAGRGFSVKQRANIAYQVGKKALDRDLSLSTIFALAAVPTHHQKTVLVDYLLPESAIGFVMGHNMLDEYWDTDAHSSQRRRGSPDPWEPNKGPCGALPRQDISCQVTGPVLHYLHNNFAAAWFATTTISSPGLRHSKKDFKLRDDCGTPMMAQILRTQPQGDGLREIEALYLNAVRNATNFIYIENQYFRWPPLAEAIKKTARDQTQAGRNCTEHGMLYLFVVTNVTDEGIGSGTVNTQRMLESLGRADTIPNVTKQLQMNAVSSEFARSIPYDKIMSSGMAPDVRQDFLAQTEAYHRRLKEIEEAIIAPVELPGLKVHVCSLVAQDSTPDHWIPVYIHSKLMIIDDVFTTHGSANINSRSMMVDSEINIAHEWASETQALRRRLWGLHTSGQGAQDNAKHAFKAWDRLFTNNKNRQNHRNRQSPETPLTEFYYDKPTLSDLD